MPKSPRIITNKIRDNLWRPLSSAIRGAFNPTYLEHWTSNVPPKVIGKFRRIDGHAGTVYLGSEWAPIADVSFPYAMPAAVLLSSWRLRDTGPPKGRLPDKDRRAMRVYIGGAVPAPPAWQGAFLIEWGLGEARFYAFVDMAEQKLNLPIASSVRISAQIPSLLDFPANLPDPAFVNATITPGHLHPNPWAVVTHQHFSIADDGYNFTTEMHAKELSFHIYATNVSAYANLQIYSQGNTGVVQRRMAEYLIQPPIFGNPQTRPYGLERVPMPGGAGDGVVNIFCPPTASCNTSFVQVIEP